MFLTRVISFHDNRDADNDTVSLARARSVPFIAPIFVRYYQTHMDSAIGLSELLSPLTPLWVMILHSSVWLFISHLVMPNSYNLFETPSSRSKGAELPPVIPGFEPACAIHLVFELQL